MSDDFIILSCSRTLELFRWGSKDHNVWIPLKKVRVPRGQGPNRRMVNTEIAALPGYAFVPRYDWTPMRRRCPSKFHVRPLGYDLLGRPRCCSIENLITMQKILNGEHTPARNKESTEVIRFKKGQAVLISSDHPFLAGFKGTIERIKSCGVARLNMEVGKFLEIDCSLLTLDLGEKS